MPLNVATANRLRDGRVVYRTTEGAWSERLADAAVVEGKEEAAALLAAAEADARATKVVGPYLAEVSLEEGHIVPRRFKEAIRADGPTVPSDFLE